MIRDIIFEEFYQKKMNSFFDRTMQSAYNDGAKHGVQVVLTVVHQLILEGKEITPYSIKEYIEEAAKLAIENGKEELTPQDIEQVITEEKEQKVEDIVKKSKNVVQLFPNKNRG